MTAFWDKLKKINEEKTVSASREESSSSKKKKSPVISDGKKVKKTTNNKQKTKSSVSKVNIKDKKKKAKQSKKKKKKIILTPEQAMVVDSVLVRPKISEASMNQQVMNKYVFVVKKNASKGKIKDAIENMYGVMVVKVNVMNYSPTKKMFRGFIGKNRGFRKAIVTLKQGDSINLFKE